MIAEKDLQLFEERLSRYNNDPQIWGIKQIADIASSLIIEIRKLRFQIITQEVNELVK